MVFTLIAGVNKAVLTLVVELHQHTHGAPLGPPERAELQVLVPRQRQERITAIHQVTGHQGVHVSDGGQRVGGWASNEPDDKEDLRITVDRISCRFPKTVLATLRIHLTSQVAKSSYSTIMPVKEKPAIVKVTRDACTSLCFSIVA